MGAEVGGNERERERDWDYWALRQTGHNLTTLA